LGIRRRRRRRRRTDDFGVLTTATTVLDAATRIPNVWTATATATAPSCSEAPSN
jgi:hypothetical protein